MSKKNILTAIFAVAFVIVPVLSVATPVQAIDMWGGGTSGKSQIQDALGYGDSTETDPRIVIANVVKLAMTFLGLIAVILIIYAGFKWMTAGGNPEEAKKARAIIQAAIIGLLIILAAWAIADWVTTQIQTQILQ